VGFILKVRNAQMSFLGIANLEEKTTTLYIRADYPVASYSRMTETSATPCEDLKERSKQNVYLCKVLRVPVVEYNSAS
jgi:hypothetical protein